MLASAVIDVTSAGRPARHLIHHWVVALHAVNVVVRSRNGVHDLAVFYASDFRDGLVQIQRQKLRTTPQ